MPARICPDCGRCHNHTAKHCTTCYQSNRYRRGRRSANPTSTPICAPGLCGQPATESRLVTVGTPERGNTRDTGWLFLCPDCADLFDADNARPIHQAIIPSSAAARGHIFC